MNTDVLIPAWLVPVFYGMLDYNKLAAIMPWEEVKPLVDDLRQRWCEATDSKPWEFDRYRIRWQHP